MLGRRKDPPSGLKLVDLAQPLQPRVIDQLTFGNLPVREPGRSGEGNIAMNGIMAEVFTVKSVHRLDYAR